MKDDKETNKDEARLHGNSVRIRLTVRIRTSTEPYTHLLHFLLFLLLRMEVRATDYELEVSKHAFEERGFSFFRSEKMQKVSITLPTSDEALAVETIRALGKAEICQFDDVSNPPSLLSPGAQ